MLVIGLTGGTGSGKGCVSASFLQFNINAIDTDKVSRIVCEKGAPCLNELVSFFGQSILNPDKTLNRRALASIAFSDKQKLESLNKITHKHILAYTRNWLEEQKANGRVAAIVDAPLLYESGFDKECDKIITVISDRETRTKRIIARDNLSLEDAEKRLNNQGDDEFYIQKADFIITNNGTLNDVDKQVKEIYNQLFESANK